MEATIMDTARSLWIIYQQMPGKAQQAFKQMLNIEHNSGYTNIDWLPLSTPSLATMWDTPEEDNWDELYAKQHGEG